VRRRIHARCPACQGDLGRDLDAALSRRHNLRGARPRRRSGRELRGGDRRQCRAVRRRRRERRAHRRDPARRRHRPAGRAQGDMPVAPIAPVAEIRRLSAWPAVWLLAVTTTLYLTRYRDDFYPVAPHVYVYPDEWVVPVRAWAGGIVGFLIDNISS